MDRRRKRAAGPRTLPWRLERAKGLAGHLIRPGLPVGLFHMLCLER